MFRCVMHSQRPQRSVVAARGAHCPRYIPFPKVAKMKKLFKLASTYHGVGPVTFAWQPAGNFLATAGKNGLVHIFDRQGEQYDEIGLDMGTPVLALEWDHDGNTLAILQTGNGIVPLWDLSARTTQNLDTNLKDPSFIRWSNSGTQLAIGTVKGNLVLYSKSSRKIVPVLGKHSKKITCGAWNNSDQLVLGSDDRMITVSNAGGDTLQQRELKLVPTDCKFGHRKGDSTRGPETCVAINVVKSLILLDTTDPDNPIELTFQAVNMSLHQSFTSNKQYGMVAALRNDQSV
ncbi:hypothetical protein DYB38_008922 [Aphanomyces astaci]|uniref:WDR19 first beta-propeller domain-containing protein n=1 Tax=Aphanomyces astaci TaxID=112090 RepID=A0A397DB19_APHAT|nr:hypothetical protein DYB38_008922 [Aphanomyces astaci]